MKQSCQIVRLVCNQLQRDRVQAQATFMHSVIQADQTVINICSWPVIILKQPFARTFQVIELATVRRTKEDPDREKYDQDTKRDQKI